GVALAANAVHGDGQRFMRFLTDRAVGHRPGLEALHDARDRLNLLQRDRRPSGLQLKQAAQRAEALGLIVDERAVFLEDLVVVRPDGVLELVDRFGVEKVVFTFLAVLVLAAGVQGVEIDRSLWKSLAMTEGDLVGDYVQADARDARRGPGEVLVH